MPAPLLHLSVSSEHAARDCCKAFCISKGVAEEHRRCTRAPWARGEIFEMLAVCIIIELDLYMHNVRCCIGLWFKALYFSAVP